MFGNNARITIKTPEEQTHISNALNLRRRAAAQGAASVFVLAAFCGFSFPEPANAQNSPAAPPSETVTVTGTQIQGVAPVGGAVIGRDSADIQANPITATGETDDYLRQLPQVSAISGDDTHNNAVQGGQQNATHTVSLNLRGVGQTATLMLVNGNHVAPNGAEGTFYDPDLIALDAVERVEVLADGASATYGSDAIAGVVNFVLRKKFEGARLSVGYGTANGFEQQKLSGVYGYSWDTGSLVVSGAFNFRTQLLGINRPYYRQNLTPFGGSNFSSQNCAPGNLTIGGVIYGLPNTNGTALTAAQIQAGANKPNKCDLDPLNQIFPDQNRRNVTTTVTQELTDWLRLDLDGFLYQRTYHLSTVPTANLTVTNANPFFVSPVPGLTSGTINYNFENELGNRESVGYGLEYQGDLSLTVDLPYDWTGKITYSYGRNTEGTGNPPDGTSPFAPLVNQFTAAQFIGTALLNQPAATALNLFGNGTANNPATVKNLLVGESFYNQQARISNINAVFNGSVFSIPAGDVKFALGAAVKDDGQYNSFGSNVANGTFPLTNVFTTNFRGSRTVSSAFAELYVPLVGAANAIPLVQKLELDLAGRIDNYSDVGVTKNPKIGLNWKPIDDLQIRGSYGTSFRAPVLNQLYPVYSAFVGNTVDPTSPTGTAFVYIYAGGNPTLTPEKAKNWNAGLDYKPSEIPGLVFSLSGFYIDYYNKLGQVSGSAGTTTILTQQALYANYIIKNPTAAQVQAIVANTPSEINAGLNPATIQYLIDGRSNNIGESIIKGTDFDLRYAMDTSWGAFTFDEAGTYYFQYLNNVAKGLPLIENMGQINYPTRYRSLTNITWENDSGWRAGLFITHLPSYNNVLVTPSQQVRSYTQLDTQLSYTFSGTSNEYLNGTRLALNVTNVFATEPPFVNNPSGYGYDPQNVSPVGRLISVELVKLFN